MLTDSNRGIFKVCLDALEVVTTIMKFSEYLVLFLEVIIENLGGENNGSLIHIVGCCGFLHIAVFFIGHG